MTSRSLSAPPEADDIQIIKDDLVILEDPKEREPSSRRHNLRWLLPVLPWSWFVVRGWHPWLEVFAILLPILVASAALIALVTAAYRRSFIVLTLTLSLVVFLVVSIIAPRGSIDSAAPENPTRFASINLGQQWFSDNDVSFFVEENQPEVFVAIELSPSHDEALRERFEHWQTDLFGLAPDPALPAPSQDLSQTYRRNDAPSIALFSAFEIEILDDPIAEVIDGGLPGFRARVDVPGPDVVVYALHLPRPGTGSGLYEVRPGPQRDMIEAIANAIEQEELPTVVLGDLNIVDRGASYELMTNQLTDAMRVDRTATATRERDIWHSLLHLRIDHLLIGPELCAIDSDAPKVLFSDHRPIQADIGQCPSA